MDTVKFNKILLILILFLSIDSSMAQRLASISPSKAILAEKDQNDFHFSSLPLLTPVQSMPDINPLRTEINYPILAGVGAVTLASGIGIHIYQSNAWWKGERSKFRFVNDWKYALWLDKLGHFYGTTLLYHAFSSGLDAANFNSDKTAIYSAIGAFAFQMYVEIEDGFGKNWGFSPGDAAFDFLGASYSLGQHYFPVLKNFQPRVSYYPSLEQREGKRKDGNIIDDYEGQKYWMGIRMKNILPKPIAKYWPSFLMLSVGMGLDNWNGFGKGDQDIYIAFDLDADTIPLHGGVWQFIKNTLNKIHFPMPGVRITPHAAFFAIVY